MIYYSLLSQQAPLEVYILRAIPPATTSTKTEIASRHAVPQSRLVAHGFPVVRIQSSPFETKPIDIDFHVHFPTVSKLPMSTRFRDLSQLVVAVERLGAGSGLFPAKEIARGVGRSLHGDGRTGKVGPDVVDLVVVEGNRDEMEPWLDPI